MCFVFVDFVDEELFLQFCRVWKHLAEPQEAYVGLRNLLAALQEAFVGVRNLLAVLQEAFVSLRNLLALLREGFAGVFIDNLISMI